MSLLDQEKLSPSPTEQELKKDVVEPVIEIFAAQAITQRVTLQLRSDLPVADIRVSVDKMRC